MTRDVKRKTSLAAFIASALVTGRVSRTTGCSPRLFKEGKTKEKGDTMYLDRIIPFTMPTNIIHGIGAAKLIPAECKRLGVKKVFLVTDEGLVMAGVTKEVTAIFEESKIPYVVYDKVEVDPVMKTVDEGERFRKAEGCDGIVIVGGGSPLCAGKAIAMLATNGGKIADYEGVGKNKTAPLAVIGVPTTAGSGSEVSPTFIITNEERGSKMTIRGNLTHPPSAILDPNLLRSLPPRQAVWSSLDALTHAVESLATNLSTPLTDAIALRSLQMMFKSLVPAAFTDDIAAKSEQLLASTMANIACGNAMLGLAHAFNHPFGHLNIPHGMACGLMLPFVMEYNLPACREKFAQMATAIGEKTDQSEDALAGSALERLKKLYVEVGFPTRVTEKEVPREQLDYVVREAARAVQVRFNVRRANEKDLMGIMERAYKGF
jgi:alcohol dehydrogenase class IV